MTRDSDLMRALESLRIDFEAAERSAKAPEPNDYLAGHIDSTKYWAGRVRDIIIRFSHLANPTKCPVCESRAIKSGQNDSWKCSLCGVAFLP